MNKVNVMEDTQNHHKGTKNSVHKSKEIRFIIQDIHLKTIITKLLLHIQSFILTAIHSSSKKFRSTI